ncbi:hypothetical protein [Candidatus Palauibacter sp.]|uniref:hypothetical protein n=1 Tax=Candidatus Palauibacter sp. TaxID=3101350 RepID=UPI003B011EBB
MSDPRRRLPSMDSLLKRPEVGAWIDRYGRETVKDALRRALDGERSAAGGGPGPAGRDPRCGGG